MKKCIYFSIIALLSAHGVMPFSFFYQEVPVVREVPVVVYHEPVVHRHVVYNEPSVGEIAGCAVGAAIGCGIASLITQNSQKKQMIQYTEMFQDLGYDQAQAKVYAKMALETEGGFQAVVKNIEREKEARRQIEAQKQIEALKHQQKLEKMSYEHQLNSLDNNKITFNKNTLLLCAIVCALIFAGLLFVVLKRKNK
ncbi:MAG TPA: hypothetical protein VLG50_04275 [Candidatus Saccharimonadales bacterium]|nr:hypothetical protein [Candidatus Saccharimonadales bacterium]